MATLHAGDGDTADGDVPAAMLAAQMAVLNTAFAPLGFSFVLAGVDKFTNASVRFCLLSKSYGAPTAATSKPSLGRVWRAFGRGRPCRGCHCCCCQNFAPLMRSLCSSSVIGTSSALSAVLEAWATLVGKINRLATLGYGSVRAAVVEHWGPVAGAGRNEDGQVHGHLRGPQHLHHHDAGQPARVRANPPASPLFLPITCRSGHSFAPVSDGSPATYAP